MTTYISVSNPGSSVAVDGYLALIFPDGTFEFFESTGSGLISHPAAADPSTWTKLVSNFTLPAYLINAGPIPIYTYTLTGSKLPGMYQWVIGVTAAGTLNVLDVDSAGYSLSFGPTASFTAPGSTLTGERVTFDASGSTDPKSSITSFSFNFGDGSAVVTQTTPIFTHSYATAGTFSVSLVVTDAQGATASTSGEISVGVVLSQPVNISNSAGWSQGQDFAIDEQGAINVV